MKFLRYIIMLLAVPVLSSAVVNLADNIQIDAEFRPRWELDNRDFNAGTGYDSYGTFRTRLGIGLNNLIENTELYLMIGDSRTMGYADPYLQGEAIGPNKQDNNLGVIKAYMQIDRLFNHDIYLKVGRQSNDQGRGYIFGPGNWNFYGPRVYDGIKVGWSAENFDVNAWSYFGAKGDRHWYPVDDDPSKVPNLALDYKRDHTLTGIDASFLKRKLNLLFFMDLDQQPVLNTTSDESNVAWLRYTVALNGKFNIGAEDQHKIDFDAAYQFGSQGYDEGNAEVAAWMLAGDYSIAVQENSKTRVGVGFHLFSGDDFSDPEKVTWFYDNYASKHKILGHMDYFKNDMGLRSAGLRDLILRFTTSPGKMTLQMDLHHFSVEKPFASAVDVDDSKLLGQEIDTLLKLRIRKGLDASLGIDLFLPSDDWQGEDADPALFHYLVLQANL